ncbi:MAG: potassium/proton antiporter [Chloroflexota bacterium]|nr:potassium/proton antiporter [Chloroflexota bacterium]
MMWIEHLLLVVALILCLSVLASKVAVKTNIPVLLLFLGLGMLAGSDGIGGIYFDLPWVAQAVGVVALTFILFSGGMNTSWYSIRPVLGQGITLASVGVLITALTVGVFASALLGLTLAEGVLLGAIISATDAAAVFAVLRGSGIRLKPRLTALLELESGSNDPMAVFLTLGMISLITHPNESPLSLIPTFFLQMGIGLGVGFGLGRLLVAALNRLRLEYEGLYPVLTTAGALLVYGAAASLYGNGFLAVYVAGLVLGRENFIHKRSLLRFHDGIAWIMQILMFLTLGLQVFPSRLPSVAGNGLLVALFLIVVARPLSVFIGLVLTALSWREKAFIAWVGMRGAAPIVLATFPVLAGVGRADDIFHLIFFIVLTSVLLQGTLLARMAKFWGVTVAQLPTSISPLASVMRDGEISDNLLEIAVQPSAPAVGQRILDLKLPPGVLVALIGRGHDLITPNGGTIIEAGDKMLIVSHPDLRTTITALMIGGTP